MPLVRIDLIKGRSREALRAIADTLHDCATDAFSLPPRDRFQIITEHEAHMVIVEDVGLGFDRSDDLVVVQVTSTPRSLAARKAFYELAAEKLSSDCGIAPQNLMINIVTVSESDWSFGMGRAQFLTGEL
jgi:phenylpyruvate tautomerase PptA (4-oxalocrotonate tautomerase family)